MNKINIEFDIPEIVKLISMCNAAIVSAEESVRYLPQTSEVREMTLKSIEKMWEIKHKLKTEVNKLYGTRCHVYNYKNQVSDDDIMSDPKTTKVNLDLLRKRK